MNDHPTDQVLALYSSCDVSSSEYAQLTAHLDSCQTCRSALDDLKDVQQLLRAAFPEPDDLELQHLRASIIERVDRQKGTNRRPWVWNAAIAAVTTIAFIVTVHRGNFGLPDTSPPLYVRSIPPPVQIASELPLPSAPVLMTRLSLPPGSRSARARRSHAEAGIRAAVWNIRSNGSSQLKLTTADANVVILLPLTKASDQNEN
ncbi:MAG: hypothetical protein M3Y72_00060 [Acidobacteriota bacterium]|nr:hypothetical protein [Acidobacteriota bacterium]